MWVGLFLPVENMASVMRFRVRRTQTGYYAIGGLFGLLFISDTAHALSSSSNRTSALYTGLLAAAAVGVGLRAHWAASITLDGSTLTYRSLMRTRRFKREEVAGVEVRQMQRRLRLWSRPYLRLRNGTDLSLTELSIPTQGFRSEAISGERPEVAAQAEMIRSISAWLRVAPPGATIR